MHSKRPILAAASQAVVELPSCSPPPGAYIIGEAESSWQELPLAQVYELVVGKRAIVVRQASCCRGVRAWHPQGKGATASAIWSVILRFAQHDSRCAQGDNALHRSDEA